MPIEPSLFAQMESDRTQKPLIDSYLNRDDQKGVLQRPALARTSKSVVSPAELSDNQERQRKSGSVVKAKASLLPDEDIDRLLTIDQAAVQLSVSRRTLYRMIAADEFPKPVRVGGSKRIVQSELVEFLDRVKQRRRA